MRHVALVVASLAYVGAVVSAHGSGNAITWNREISRLVIDKCASCHRPDGSAFSLLTYKDAQPRATAIKAAVLARTMPPWGAVKGFGNFRNDQGLSQEQIELVTKWVDGGIRRGNNAAMLPKAPEFTSDSVRLKPDSTYVRVSGTVTLNRTVLLDGLFLEQVQPGQSFQVVAVLPSGHVEPLLWLHGYDSRYSHPFLLRTKLQLPVGTVISGVPRDAVLVLLS